MVRLCHYSILKFWVGVAASSGLYIWFVPSVLSFLRQYSGDSVDLLCWPGTAGSLFKKEKKKICIEDVLPQDGKRPTGADLCPLQGAALPWTV